MWKQRKFQSGKQKLQTLGILEDKTERDKSVSGIRTSDIFVEKGKDSTEYQLE